MRERERAAREDAGFFIPRLGEWVLGPAWYEGALAGDLPPPGAERAAAWLHPALLDPAYAARIAGAFASDPDVPHVFLDRPVLGARAEEIHAALAAARFAPHHHAPYRIAVARRDGQAPSALTAFVDWLATREAASFHHWLVGRLLPAGMRIQVQTARAAVGDRFPTHIDTEAPGLAAVYNFTRDWDPSFGGVLRFERPEIGADLLVIPPRFNSVLLFEPRGAPHHVSEVLPAAGERVRYTVTAFWLDASVPDRV